MKTIEEFWKQLLKKVISFSTDKWSELKADAIEDSNKFLTEVKDDVQRWVTLLVEGKLTSSDLQWLIKGNRDLAKLLLLKEKGLSQPDLDKFFEGLIGTIITTAFELVLE
jgi:hypothetical protein